jgi:transcriptional regulator with XRE-family HTH domain
VGNLIIVIEILIFVYMAILNTGQRIEQLREDKGWSQKELARRVDLTGVTIGKYESGATEAKGTDLVKIAKALGTTARVPALRNR